MSSLSSLSPDPKTACKHLLVVQRFVGIGDMVWHRPWFKHLAGRFDVILAARPTTHAKMLFHGADAVLVVHHSAAFTPVAGFASIPLRWAWLRRQPQMAELGRIPSRAACHEQPYRKLGLYAHANCFSLGQLHWRILANDGAVQAICTCCDDYNITSDPVNDSDCRDIEVFCVGGMDTEWQWPPPHFAQLAAAIKAEWPGLNIVLTGVPSEASIFQAVMSDEAAPAGLIQKSGPLDEALALIRATRLHRQ